MVLVTFPRPKKDRRLDNRACAQCLGRQISVRHIRTQLARSRARKIYVNVGFLHVHNAFPHCRRSAAQCYASNNHNSDGHTVACLKLWRNAPQWRPSRCGASDVRNCNASPQGRRGGRTAGLCALPGINVKRYQHVYSLCHLPPYTWCSVYARTCHA